MRKVRKILLMAAIAVVAVVVPGKVTKAEVKRMEFNKTYDTTFSDKDYNVYEFSVSSDSKVVFDCTNKTDNSVVIINVAPTDEDEKRFVGEALGSGHSYSKRVVGYLKKGTYHLVLHGRYSEGECNFKGSVTPIATNTIDGNHDAFHAQTISNGAIIKGILANGAPNMTEGPDDWFKFKLTKKTAINIVATPSSNYFGIRVYNNNLKEVYCTTNSSGNSYVRSKELDAGTYYIYLGGPGEHEGGAYTLSFKTATKPGKVKVTSVKAKKKKAVVKIAKLSGVTRYQVKYGTKKSFARAKTKTIKATSVTLTKLKSKKKYYIKARAYTTFNGKKYYGAWGNVKKVKVK